MNWYCGSWARCFFLRPKLQQQFSFLGQCCKSARVLFWWIFQCLSLISHSSPFTACTRLSGCSGLAKVLQSLPYLLVLLLPVLAPNSSKGCLWANKTLYKKKKFLSLFYYLQHNSSCVVCALLYMEYFNKNSPGERCLCGIGGQFISDPYGLYFPLAVHVFCFSNSERIIVDWAWIYVNTCELWNSSQSFCECYLKQI